MKRWRGDYVIVFPGDRVKFHRCVVCRQPLRFHTDSSTSGVGPECARKPADLVAAAKQKALEEDRRRYRAEVLDHGFKIENER